MKKLNSYRGSLTPRQVVEGMNAARRNAKRLAEDAKLLFEAERFPSAAALAILSIEESGKTSVLRGLAVASNEDELVQGWKGYRTHATKNAHWILLELAESGARKLSDFSQVVSPSSDHSALLDSLKQVAFYTDCLGSAHWSEPSECITKELADSLVFIADTLSKSDSEITEQEIRLWVKHLQPAWHMGDNARQKAILDWHDEMVRSGLARNSQEFFERFIKG